jgi:serine/threonine-protein kinase
VERDRDARLARLLAELDEARRAGRGPDVQAVAREHPDLVGEFRELWAMAEFADQFGSLCHESQAASAAPPSDLAAVVPTSFGDYELLEELGRGGMGVVFRARQRSPDREVAVKMLLRGELASAADLARFRAEAESAAKLEHPNIVPLYEIGEVDGRPYFSMKLVRGVTLARRLQDGPIPSRTAARLLEPVCRAIAYAHRRGVLHRDLKPSNILLETDTPQTDPADELSLDTLVRPAVTDFGLAKRLTADPSLTGSGAIVGTPSYMAPEQAAGPRGKLSAASDVYSLGAILYQMLTGRPPFQAPSPLDTVLMVLEQDPVPPRLLNRQVDPELEWIVLKCLQKPAEFRYLTADALADDLAAYLADEPTAARKTSMREFVSRILRETHHAVVLKNWGVLWMWHALVLLVLCVTTNVLQWRGVTSPGPYLLLWIVGLGLWATTFWAVRRRAGPITFVERQIAHVWAGSVISCTLLFVVEMLLGLPVLTLSPVLGLTSGMVFLVKAGVLTGSFYLQSAALFATSALMAVVPQIGLTVFGLVSAACFFLPGLKYYRQSRHMGERSESFVTD